MFRIGGVVEDVEDEGKVFTLKVQNGEISDVCEEIRVVLKGMWSECIIQIGANVNILGRSEQLLTSSTITVGSSEHRGVKMIIHPELLVPSTSVSNASPCLRKAFIDQFYRVQDANEPIVVGNITHEIFQEALVREDFSMKTLWEITRNVIKTKTVELFELNLSEKKVLKDMAGFLREFHQWSNKYHKPSENQKTYQKMFPNIVQVTDIEETCWMPSFGIKGKFDATVSVEFESGETRANIPFELKSGKRESLQHIAQLMLYCLMASCERGLLLYFVESRMRIVPINDLQLDSLLILRNNLASYRFARMESESKQVIPAIAVSKSVCDNCFSKSSCMLLNRVYEGGNGVQNNLGEMLAKYTSHLLDAEIDYFRSWDRSIMKEESFQTETVSEIWELSSIAREQNDRCIGGLALESVEKQDGKYYYFLSFTRKLLGNGEKDYRHVFRDSEYVYMTVDSPTDKRKYSLSIWTGRIQAISDEGLVVVRAAPIPKQLTTSLNLWRLDKNDDSFMFSRMRANLLTLLDPQMKEETCKLRQLIIHLRRPAFSAKYQEYPDSLLAEVSALNDSQKHALQTALRAKDYALIQGLPGTGKTYLQVILVKVLVALRKSVLITSHTNSAIDNILTKFLHSQVHEQILRLGSEGAVAADIRSSSFYLQSFGKFQSSSEIQTFLNRKTIVGVTCIGLAQHKVLSKRTFDYCIVDEAGQVLEPFVLSPLLRSRVFVLVGDHKQLPPLVKCGDAFMETSLFQRLCDKHEYSVAQLTIQYRMNKRIAHLSNRLVYQDKLECANEDVARQTLDFQCPPGDLDWVRRVSDAENSVLFFDTSQLTQRFEKKLGHSHYNELEVSLVDTLVSRMIDAGISPTDIGVISPFQTQVKFLREVVGLVDIDTIDKYQGRDKECIILSLVRSNDTQNAGEILLDARRINVAITRAKSKFVIFGDEKTLFHSPVLKDLLEILRGKKWIYHLSDSDFPNPFQKRPLPSRTDLVMETMVKKLRECS